MDADFYSYIKKECITFHDVDLCEFVNEIFMLFVSKWIIFCFGIFLLCAGGMMLFSPARAGRILRKAGSTNFINYAEITIRMVPAIALILYADLSKYPVQLKMLGWFMLATSIILYFIPRQVHHNFSVRSANILKPNYFRLIAPLSILFGLAILYSIS
jgi:hypothetical protein